MSKAFDFAKSIEGSGSYDGLILPSGSGTGQAGEIRRTATNEVEFWSTGSYQAMWRQVEQGNLLPTLRCLLVAGGGAGGTSEYGWGGAGGGGAGGMLEVLAHTFTINTALNFTVGTGGASQNANRVKGNNGANTTFHTLTAIGGGGGGAGQRSNANSYGNSGGSGGGAGYTGTTNNGSGTSGQGNAGGIESGYYGGAGGGGAGGVGEDSLGNNSRGGHGGDGKSSDITGTPIFYAGGGGAGSYNHGGGNGGTGGGGYGGAAGANTTARDGENGLGGGGGGASGLEGFSYTYGGAGGDGIIILRVDTSMFNPTFSGTHTKTSTTIGNDTIYSITSASNASVTFTAV